jgi:hypothetical protein
VEIMAEPDSVEFRIGRVIGHSFGVFRRNFVGFSILALLINLLWWLYLFYLSPAALKALGAVGAYLLWWLIWMLTESLTQAAVVFETFHDLHGSKASIVKCITHGLTTMLPHIAGTVLFNIVRLIVVALPVLAVIFFAGWLDTTLPHFKGTLLYTIVLFIGLALSIVPGFLLYLMWAVYVPALVVEDEGILGCFGRSAELTRGRRWRIFGLMLVRLAVTTPFAYVFEALGFHDVQAIAEFVVETLAMAFSAVVGAVSYYYLRAEKERFGAGEMARAFEHKM